MSTKIPGIPGTYEGVKLQLDCPYTSEHRLPNGGWIPTTFTAGTGQWHIDENDPDPEASLADALQTVTLRCVLGHEWTPSDSPANLLTTTDEDD